MKKAVLILFLLLISTTNLLSSPIQHHKSEDERDVGYFWQITDPHLDRDYVVGSDPECSFPCCCRDFHEGQDRKAGEFGVYGKCDIPTKTLFSAFDFVKDYPVQPDYIFYTGDNPVHQIWNQTKEDVMDYAKFLRDSLYDSFRKDKKFENTKIFATLGNHDVFPVDQLDIPPNSKDILSNMADLYKEDLSESAYAMFREFGYFSMKLRPGLRLINLNTQYEDPLNFFLYKNLSDPGDQIAWLTNELSEARAQKERVWIVGHIPPGIGDRIVNPESNVNFNIAFVKLMREYGEIVVFQIYGHTHKDSFKLVLDETETKAKSVIFVTPALTNFQVQNPSVRLFKYNTSSFELIDMLTFYGNLSEANIQGSMTWRLEYSAVKDYQLEDMSPQSWFELWKRMDRDLEWWLKFEQYYHVSYTIECPSGEPQCKTNQICSIAHMLYDSYYSCVHERQGILPRSDEQERLKQEIKRRYFSDMET